MNNNTDKKLSKEQKLSLALRENLKRRKTTKRAAKPVVHKQDI